jgi:hypothetical protein
LSSRLQIPHRSERRLGHASGDIVVTSYASGDAQASLWSVVKLKGVVPATGHPGSILIQGGFTTEYSCAMNITMPLGRFGESREALSAPQVPCAPIVLHGERGLNFIIVHKNDVAL